MTCLEKLRKAERWRIKTGTMGSEGEDGWNGAFIVPVDGEMWQVILSDGMGWRHLSVTNAQKRQLPTWHIMCRMKDLFFGDEDWAVEFHPPKEAYINDHDFVLHLWQPLNEELPKPFSFMV